MTPFRPPADGGEPPPHVYGNHCGAQTPRSWSFCLASNESLADARPPDDRPEFIDEITIDVDETGRPKRHHEEAAIDEIATIGTGLAKLFDVRTRRFRVVTCTTCDYSELYRGQDADIILERFLG